MDLNIEEVMSKKEEQVAKAKRRLETKRKRNQRRDAERRRLEALIVDAKDKIKEYEKLIEYHRERIPEREEKLRGVTENEDVSAEKDWYDRVSGELEEMKVLEYRIGVTVKDIDRHRREGNLELAETLEDVLGDLEKEFRKVKGRGF